LGRRERRRGQNKGKQSAKLHKQKLVRKDQKLPEEKMPRKRKSGM
jgi:hypothetical protein